MSRPAVLLLACLALSWPCLCASSPPSSASPPPPRSNEVHQPYLASASAHSKREEALSSFTTQPGLGRVFADAVRAEVQPSLFRPVADDDVALGVLGRDDDERGGGVSGSVVMRSVDGLIDLAQFLRDDYSFKAHPKYAEMVEYVSSLPYVPPEELVATAQQWSDVQGAEVAQSSSVAMSSRRALGGLTPERQTTGCVYNELECKHGYFNSANCTEWIKCVLPGALALTPDQRCHCDYGYSGTDCSIIKSPKVSTRGCPSDENFDGTMLNLNLASKHIECFLSGERALSYSIRQHRVNVTVTHTPCNSTDKSQCDRNTQVLFDLVSRHRNASIPVGQQWHHYCHLAQHDITCHASQCSAETKDSKPTYTCNQVSCTSCGLRPKETDCSPFLGISIAQLKPPISFVFSDPEANGGSAGMEFKSGTFIMDFECATGTCTKSPIDTNPSASANQTYIVIAIFGSLVGVLLIVIAGACYTNRRKEGLDAAFEGGLDRLLEDRIAMLPKFGVIFDHVTYEVDLKKGMIVQETIGVRRILKGVTGIVQPCELVAILGSSGAGKSSFMDILAGRNKAGRVGGVVGTFSDSMRAENQDDIVNYVLQDDHLLGTQTVYESLMFSAQTRLPNTYTKAMIRSKVQSVLRDLAIEHIADSRIGHPDQGGGISGGERKRVAIGVELVAEPRFLLLDEPTSGLDSFSAHVVMKVLRKTADQGCACMLSIHQPPTKVFNMFDKVLLLTRRGQQAYFGAPEGAINHMQRIGHPVPDKWVNPAEYILEIASSDSVEELDRLPQHFYQSDDYQALHATIADTWARSLGLRMGHHGGEGAPNDMPPYGTFTRQKTPEERGSWQRRMSDSELSMHSDEENYTLMNADNGASDAVAPLPAPADGGNAYQNTVIRPQGDLPEPQTPLFVRKHPTPFQRFTLLTQRTFTHISRDPSLLTVQMLITVCVASLLGGIFFQLDSKLSGMQNRTGALFFVILYFSLVSLSSIGWLFSDRVLFMRERAAHFYSTGPYFFSKVICDLIPMRVLPSTMFAAITYYMMGLHNEPERFSTFVIVLILVNCTAMSACFTFSAACDTVGKANLFASLFFIYNMLFGGLLLNNKTNTSQLVNLQWGSFFHYAYEALMVNEFQGLELLFNPSGFATTKINGQVWLNNFGMNEEMLWNDIYALCGFFTLFLSAAYVFLRVRQIVK